ncbi:hypothetical protein INR49_017734 [Caranx melampygus]|nr:hypothetical protein INR49_017734 [Caranx melampygus]
MLCELNQLRPAVEIGLVSQDGEVHSPLEAPIFLSTNRLFSSIIATTAVEQQGKSEEVALPTSSCLAQSESYKTHGLPPSLGARPINREQ